MNDLHSLPLAAFYTEDKCNGADAPVKAHSKGDTDDAHIKDKGEDKGEHKSAENCGGNGDIHSELYVTAGTQTIAEKS